MLTKKLLNAQYLLAVIKALLRRSENVNMRPQYAFGGYRAEGRPEKIELSFQGIAA